MEGIPRGLGGTREGWEIGDENRASAQYKWDGPLLGEQLRPQHSSPPGTKVLTR